MADTLVAQIRTSAHQDAPSNPSRQVIVASSAATESPTSMAIDTRKEN
jgi:hypothetical protein